MLLVIFIAAAGMVFGDFDPSKQSMALITMVATAGQLAVAVQAMSSIRQMKISYVGLISSLLDITKVLTFDFNVVYYQCFWSTDNPVYLFALQLLCYPCLLILLSLLCAVAYLMGRNVTFVKLFNINGSILCTIFITLTLVTLLPFQCRVNPNNTTAMLQNPGVTCYDNKQHWTLVGMSIAAIFVYPVTLYTWGCYATLMFPSWIGSSRGHALCRRYLFLFGRFKQHAYFYGLIQLTRNLLVALIPVVFVSIVPLQVVLMGCVLLIGGAIQTQVWPWKTDFANRSDEVVSFGLVIIIIAAAPLMDAPQDTKENVLGILMFIMVITIWSTVLFVMFYAIYRRFRRTKTYAAFLCHHKLGAGSWCRFAKMTIEKYGHGNVFLDSDNLEDLDLLFNIVRTDVSNLVIVLTPEVLKRMWCAGEIVTSVRNMVNIVPLVCEDFEFPSDADVDSFTSVWTDDQKEALNAYSISVEDIKAAYVVVRESQAETMNRHLLMFEQEKQIITLMSRCKISTRVRSKVDESTADKAKVFIVGCTNEVEPLATCHVLKNMMMHDLGEEVELLRSKEQAENFANQTTDLIVVLTRGALVNPVFAGHVLAIFVNEEPMAKLPSNASVLKKATTTKTVKTDKNMKDLAIAIINADINFEFPTLEFYKALERDGLPDSGLGIGHGAKLSICYRAMMKLLAQPLSPQASKSLLSKQVGDISKRLKGRAVALSRAALSLSGAGYSNEDNQQAKEPEDKAFSRL